MRLWSVNQKRVTVHGSMRAMAHLAEATCTPRGQDPARRSPRRYQPVLYPSEVNSLSMAREPVCIHKCCSEDSKSLRLLLVLAPSAIALAETRHGYVGRHAQRRRISPFSPSELSLFPRNCEDDLALQNPIHDENGIPDLVLISADGIHFHVHYWKLSQESYNSFDALLPIDYTPAAGNTTWRRLFEPAAVLRIILCAIYGRFGNNDDIPLLHDIFSALEALEKYGFQPRAFTLPRSPLQSYLLSYTSHLDNAIQIYAIAANYGLKDIAVTTSAYLLDYPLTNINDILADYMGSFYMLRLAQLQEDRISKLRELIFKEPSLHGPQPSCGFENQKRVTIGWARAVADLGWRISPGSCAVISALVHLSYVC